MAKKNPELHKKKLLEALERNLGIVTPACKEVGISRDRYYTYYNEDPEFKKKVDELTEFTLDFVETKLFQNIKEGSEKSILFYMKYKGRKRGYIDEMKINSNIQGIETINITIKGDDKKEEGSE
jgi:ACT domain-containing protein